MEVNKHINSRDDCTNAYGSFGSNGLPYYQPQKISIGVMAEVTRKINSGVKDDEAVLKTAEKEASRGKFAEENFKGSVSVNSFKRKHPEAPEDTFQRISTSTRSLHQPTETVQFHKTESSVLQSNKIVNKKSKSAKETPIKKTFQFDKNQTSGQKKINIPDSGRKRKTGRNIEKVEELAAAAVQESDKLNKGEPEEKAANQSNGALRMKLSEILGSTPSPTKKSLHFETPHIGVKDVLKIEGHFDQKGVRARNPRQNSDTIETDSESLNENIRRPVTRSLTRKKVSTKLQQKNNYKIGNAENLPNSLRSECGHRRINIFSFSDAEVWSRSLHSATNVSSCSLMLKNRERNSSKVEQEKTCFSQMITPEKTQQTTEKGKTSAKKSASHGTDGFHGRSCQEIHHSPAKKRIYQQEDLNSPQLHVATNISSSSLVLKNSERNDGKVEQQKTCFSQMISPEKSLQATTEKGRTSAKKSASHGTDRFHGHSCQDDEEHLKSIDGIMKEIHHSPAKKAIYQEEDFNCPQLQVEVEPEEDFHCQPSKENEGPQVDVNTQTLGMESPLSNNSPNSPKPKDKQTEQSAHFPPAAARWHMENGFSSFRTLWTSKAGSFQFDLETDDFGKLNTSSPRKLSLAEEEKESGDRMSQSSSEEPNAESFEQDPTIKKGSKTTKMWPKNSDYCKISLMLHTNKRLDGRGGIRINESRSSSPSLKDFAGTQESNGLEGPSDGNHEDSSSRAVAHFALALERFRNKMKSMVVKRSTELVTSVAEEAQLQLENVESQIARNEEKFRSLEDSKRKTLEKKFQEQQELLNLIHEKFKKEISKHLEDCKKTLEELEIYQREQKGNAGKLKSLHRKLILQVEEGIAGQLSDAERRITTVQKAARQKMFQLRHRITECLREGDDSW